MLNISVSPHQQQSYSFVARDGALNFHLLYCCHRLGTYSRVRSTKTSQSLSVYIFHVAERSRVQDTLRSRDRHRRAISSGRLRVRIPRVRKAGDARPRPKCHHQTASAAAVRQRFFRLGVDWHQRTLNVLLGAQQQAGCRRRIYTITPAACCWRNNFP